jgi:hypothetical protein
MVMLLLAIQLTSALCGQSRLDYDADSLGASAAVSLSVRYKCSGITPETMAEAVNFFARFATLDNNAIKEGANRLAASQK